MKAAENKNIDTLVYGRIPPQNIDAETAVLGAILIDKSAIDEVIEMIPDASVFYKDSHQKIYAAITDVYNSGSNVDLITVMNRLSTTNQLDSVGGAYSITQLTMNVVSSAHIREHCDIIINKWKLRETIRVCANAVAECYKEDDYADTVLDKAVTGLMTIAQSSADDATVHVSSAVMETMQDIEDAMQADNGIIGIDTGIREVNQITNGWQDTDLIVIAARPGKGKTSLALSTALAAVSSTIHSPKPVAIFSLEMGKNQLVKRMISSLSGVNLARISRNHISDNGMAMITDASGLLGSMPIYINDKAALNVTEFRAAAKRLKKKHDIGLIIVDYLQLMTVSHSRGMNTSDVLGLISAALKQVAKELQIPVIALSQMNRDIERSNRKPTMADLRSSGNIEQDADIIVFVHHSESAETGDPKTELIFAKHRGGETGDVEVKFVPQTQSWVSVEDPDFKQFQTFSATDNPGAGIQKKNADLIDQIGDTPF